MCLYTGTFVSQYFGNGQLRRIGAIVWQGVWIGLLASPLAMLPMLFADAIFALSGHAEQVRVEEVTYFWIVSLSTPFMLVSQAFSCFYSGQGKTRIVMLVDMGSVLLNIVLDYLWIFGHAGFPAAGIAGAAWATFVAIVAKVVVYLALLARAGNRRKYGALDWAFDWPLCRRLLKFGGPAGLQMLLEVAGFTVFVFLVGSLGIQELAATNLAFNVSSLAFMPVLRPGHGRVDPGGTAARAKRPGSRRARHVDKSVVGHRVYGGGLGPVRPPARSVPVRVLPGRNHCRATTRFARSRWCCCGMSRPTTCSMR